MEKTTVLKPSYALVLSHDAVAAALVSGAAELAGLEPIAIAVGEAIPDTLRRVRPATVIADCNHDRSAGAYVGPATMIGARVAVFCSSSDAAAAARAQQLAERYDLAFFLLPEDTDALQAYLNEIGRSSREQASPAGGSSRG